jgi:hypothetical protein
MLFRGHGLYAESCEVCRHRQGVDARLEREVDDIRYRCGRMSGRQVGGLSVALDGVELCEGLPEVVVGDLVVVDLEAVEDHLVEHAALLFVAAAVELLGFSLVGCPVRRRRRGPVQIAGAVASKY